MITLAGLVREAAACTAEGRPLYAGHADLDWPDAPHLVMWHALTLLREHCGARPWQPAPCPPRASSRPAERGQARGLPAAARTAVR